MYAQKPEHKPIRPSWSGRVPGLPTLPSPERPPQLPLSTIDQILEWLEEKWAFWSSPTGILWLVLAGALAYWNSGY